MANHNTTHSTTIEWTNHNTPRNIHTLYLGHKYHTFITRRGSDMMKIMSTAPGVRQPVVTKTKEQARVIYKKLLAKGYMVINQY